MLSIITITFQDPDGLSETLASLHSWQQLGISWEHVVVDASVELNRTALTTLPANWPLVHKVAPASGIYQAQNLGIESSRGEFVLFLNGGDRLHSAEELQKALRRLEATIGSELLIATAGIFRNKIFHRWQLAPKNLESGILGENKICHQATLYRRTLFQRIGNYSENFSLAADYEHFFRAFLAGARAIISPEKLVEFEQGGASSNFFEVFKQFRQVQLSFLDRLSLLFRIRQLCLWWLGMARIGLIILLRKHS